MSLFLPQKQICWHLALHYLLLDVMFLSAVWTLNLTAPIHCRGYNTKFLQICSDEQTNSFTYACKWERLKIKGAVHRYYPLSLFTLMLFLQCMTLFLQRNTTRWKTRDFELKIVINLVIFSHNVIEWALELTSFKISCKSPTTLP